MICIKITACNIKLNCGFNRTDRRSCDNWNPLWHFPPRAAHQGHSLVTFTAFHGWISSIFFMEFMLTIVLICRFALINEEKDFRFPIANTLLGIFILFLFLQKFRLRPFLVKYSPTAKANLLWPEQQPWQPIDMTVVILYFDLSFQFTAFHDTFGAV